MGLQDILYQKIKEEIEKDPESVGYAGKSDDDVQALLINPVRKQRVVEDVTIPPISRILSGISDMPNTVSVQDVTDAKKITEINE